jgi:PAS domain S-box-containing protein
MNTKKTRLAQDQTQIILDSIADGVFTVDKHWKITSFNQAAEKITGISRIEAIGRHCWEVFRAGVCESKCSLRETMESGQPVVNRSIHIINSEGERIPVSISTALLKDRQGCIYGGVETFRDLSQLEELQKELLGRHSFMDIISKNRAMHKLFGILPQIAESDSTVLIQGESGTGKELFARAIHALSHRKHRPLITINCGALPDTLLESELFGYKAGAFTDAKRDKPGRLALADGGTLFLDEAGDISPAFQVKLLRVLQEKTYEPIGGTGSVKADVRILAATNQNLAKLVKKGTFRQDFYYRINVVAIELPPLRDRKEDIPLLVDDFVHRLRRARGKDISGVSAEVLGVLMRYDFPGNVRELENVVEHAFVICPGGVLSPEHLPPYLLPSGISGPGLVKSPLPSGTQSLREMEKLQILELLRKNNWNRSTTAKELGIHKTTLWRKIKALGIQTPELDGRSRV